MAFMGNPGYPQPGQYGASQQPPRSDMGTYSALSRPPQIPMTPGKMIDNETNIAANDVPMDGSIALFMLKDLSGIIAKAWNSGGTIDTVRYVPEKPPQQVQTATDSEFQTRVFERLDSIEKALRSRRQNYPKKGQQPRKEE